jgi:hypothetical protein
MKTDTGTGLTLDELRISSCRYPLGDQWARVELFCGEPAEPGCSWCKQHRRRVFARLSGTQANKPATRHLA